MNIVFDFGAVLFTWQPVNLVQKHFGHLTPTAEAATALAQAMFHHDDWRGFDEGEHELDEVVARTALRLDLPRDALDAMLNPIGERLLPIAATVALLDRLRSLREAGADLRLYFLSNMPRPYARVLEERHAFLAAFDGGIFSGDVKLAKPQPAIYQLLADRYALAPAQTVFIDDMQVNVDAARALGWHGIIFESPEQLETELLMRFVPDARIQRSKIATK